MVVVSVKLFAAVPSKATHTFWLSSGIVTAWPFRLSCRVPPDVNGVEVAAPCENRFGPHCPLESAASYRALNTAVEPAPAKTIVGVVALAVETNKKAAASKLPMANNFENFIVLISSRYFFRIRIWVWALHLVNWLRRHTPTPRGWVDAEQPTHVRTHQIARLALASSVDTLRNRYKRSGDM